MNLHRTKSPSHVWIVLLAAIAVLPLWWWETSPSTGEAVAAMSQSSLTPTFSQPGGYYERDVTLALHSPVPGATILFTRNGQVPTPETAVPYRQPILITAEAAAVTVIRARLVLPDGRFGPTVSASYLVNVPARLPLMSLIVDPDDLWDASQGIYVNFRQRGTAWERPVDVTYVDEDRGAGFHTAAGLRIHGQQSRQFDKKPLRLYFRRQYGRSRLEYPLFGGSDGRSFKRLVLHMGGQDSSQYAENWTLLRNRLVAELAQETNALAVEHRPVLLFINGRPWGIYTMRERIDRHLLSDRYGVDEADLLDTPELIAGSHVVEGDREHWDALMRFVARHDLADPAHYAYVRTQMDVDNFIDYAIVQIYAVNTDWPHHNVNQFRARTQGGRWHWLFWDSDATFARNLYGHVDENMIERALRPDHPYTDGKDTLLLRKLLQNPTFSNRFLTRVADLLNMTLATENVLAHIDALTAEMGPDIAYEVGRWSTFSTSWEANVEALRDFVRVRPDYVRRHVVDRFQLSGVTTLTFNPPAITSAGTVAVNGRQLPSLPWQGVYFSDTTIAITAVPATGYRFVGWEEAEASMAASATISLTVTTPQTFTPRFEPVSDGVPRAGDVAFVTYGVDDPGRIEGDWIRLRVERMDGIDLRGWRITDNDTQSATDEGSLIFSSHAALAQVPPGTEILIVATETTANDAQFPTDDLNPIDGQMTLYVGNGHLDGGAEPWFNLAADDNLALLAPGPGAAFADDVLVAFVPVGTQGRTAVTPLSFGLAWDGDIVP